MKRKYWIWSGVIFLILAVIIIAKLSKDNRLKVVIENISKKDLIETVSGSGKIFPETEIKITPDVSGEITNIYVQEGDKVNKGQVIATIKSVSTKSNFNFTMPAMMGAQQNPASEPKEVVKNVSIYSPISGIVTSVFLKKGERIIGASQMMNNELMRIADMSNIKVQIQISENEIQKIRINDTAIVKVEAYNNETFKGIVTRIAQADNSNNNFSQNISSLTDQMVNYGVTILLFKNSYEKLANNQNNFMPFRSGMSANADIQTQYAMQCIAVPINAVTTRDANDSVDIKNENLINEIVFVVNKNNEAVKREIKTGIQNNQYIQILSGVSENDKIIIAPYSAIARTLKDKMKVKVVTKKELYKTTDEDN